MDFKDSIKQISDRIEKLKDNLPTEEATKNALIMPFLTALGYDVFNPLEVLPEMDCDLTKDKGEKIDYAILKDGEPIILIECKHWQQDLNLHNTQLKKYFVSSKAKFGILTNGIVYRFYTDLMKPNIMDEKPFLDVNMLSLKDAQIEELKKFHKSYFNIETILSSASELKYMGELKSAISKEFSNPTSEFVRYFGKQVYDGAFTQKITEQFTELIRRTINNYINDLIAERLNAAINDDKEDAKDKQNISDNKEDVTDTKESRIITTNEELEAFYIVKSILRNITKADDIIYKDSITRFSIFYAGNKSQTICQLRLDGKKKTISFQIGQGDYESFPLNTIDNIYDYSDKLIESAKKCI